jgi:hypothetical protein
MNRFCTCLLHIILKFSLLSFYLLLVLTLFIAFVFLITGNYRVNTCNEPLLEMTHMMREEKDDINMVNLTNGIMALAA